MLGQSLETLQHRVEVARAPLQNLQDRRDLILDRLDANIQGIRAEVTSAARVFYEDAGGHVPEWATELQPKTELAIFRGNAARVEQLTKEVSDHIESRLADAFLEWQRVTLQPLLDERVSTLTEGLNEDAKQFLAEADSVRLDLAGSAGGLRENIALEHKDASPLERIVAAGGGLILGGPGAALMGAAGGVRGLTSGLLPQLAIGVAGILVLGPGIFLVGLLLGAGVLQNWLKRERTRDELQAEIGKEAARELRGLQGQRASDVGAAVEQQLTVLREQVATGLEREVTRVHEQIDVVLSAKRSGESEVEAERRTLASARRELDQINHMVGDVLVDLATL
jgi:hypothetical protein